MAKVAISRGHTHTHTHSDSLNIYVTYLRLPALTSVIDSVGTMLAVAHTHRWSLMNLADYEKMSSEFAQIHVMMATCWTRCCSCIVRQGKTAYT